MFFSGNKVVPVNPLVDFNSSSLFQTAGDFTTPFSNTHIKMTPHQSLESLQFLWGNPTNVRFHQPTDQGLATFVRHCQWLDPLHGTADRIRSAGVVGKGGCVGEKVSKFEPFTHKVHDFLENYDRYLEFGCVQTILFYDHHRCMKPLQVITASSLR